MVHSLVRKEGVPALAYQGCDKSLTWFCMLKIVHMDDEFAVSLELSLPSHDADHKQMFILRYEGDNLVPGKHSLEESDVPFPATLTSTMQRHGNPDFHALSLTLKNWCSVWYPKETTSLHDDFPRLLTLTRTKEVRIFFDANWLADRNFQILQDIVAGSQQLSKLSRIGQFTASYQELDWSLVKFIPDAAHPPDAPTKALAPGTTPFPEAEAEAEAPTFRDVIHDNPPPYTHPSGKRTRRSNPSLTPDDHDAKRIRGHSRSSLETDSTSPTPSLGSKSPASSSATDQVDLFQEAVDSAVEQRLPHILNKMIPQVVREELPSVVRKELPRVIRKELPHALEKFFRKTIADSPSRSSSPGPPRTKIPNEPVHGASRPDNHFTLSKLITDAVTTVVRGAVDEAHDLSSELYNSASIELEEYSQELKFNMATATEDHITDCNENLDRMVATAEERLANYLTDFEAQADEVMIETEDRLRTISKQLLCSSEGHIVLKPGQRATSLPVMKHGENDMSRT